MPRSRTNPAAGQVVERKPDTAELAAPDEQPDTASPVQEDHGVASPDTDSLAPPVEALLLTADRPMGAGRIAQTLVESGLPESACSAASIRHAIETLNRSYEQSGRAFRIEAVAGGYRVMTLARFAPVVAVLRGQRENSRLSRAAVETLAIIAYRQPITRVDIESIRGAATGEVLRTLLEKRLIAIVGRAEELGRPMLYGTSRRFLEVFGLASLKDLPPAGENGAIPGLAVATPAADRTPDDVGGGIAGDTETGA